MFSEPEIEDWKSKAEQDAPVEEPEILHLTTRPITLPGIPKPSSPVRQVFDHWAKACQAAVDQGIPLGNPAAWKLTKQREAKIKARFKEGYTLEQLCQAVDGCLMTPHNVGDNSNNDIWIDLELICRDGSHVERFARTAADPTSREAADKQVWRQDLKKQGLGEIAIHNLEVRDRFLARGGGDGTD